MSAVWKYELPDIERHPVDLEWPAGQIVHVGRDPRGQWCAWVHVHNEDAATVKRCVYMVGTGHYLPDSAISHVSTITDGPFVWHFFVTDES